MQKLRERDQLAAERQQLSNDLSNLQKKLRDAARQMAPTQPESRKSCAMPLLKWISPISTITCREQPTGSVAGSTPTQTAWRTRSPKASRNSISNSAKRSTKRARENPASATNRQETTLPRSIRSSASAASLKQWLHLRVTYNSKIKMVRIVQHGPRNGKLNQSNQSPQSGNQQGQSGRASQQPDQSPIEPDETASPEHECVKPPASQRLRRASIRIAQARAMVKSEVRSGQSGDTRYGGGGPADDVVWGNINTGNNRYGQEPPTSCSH